MLCTMADEPGSPDLTTLPSRPRAGRWLRLLVYLLLLTLACGATWWIDQGRMLTNSTQP